MPLADFSGDLQYVDNVETVTLRVFDNSTETYSPTEVTGVYAVRFEEEEVYFQDVIQTKVKWLLSRATTNGLGSTVPKADDRIKDASDIEYLIVGPPTKYPLSIPYLVDSVKVVS